MIPRKIVERIKRSIVSGTIILFHERPAPAVCLKALEQLLQELTAEHFQLILPEPENCSQGGFKLLGKPLERTPVRGDTLQAWISTTLLSRRRCGIGLTSSPIINFEIRIPQPI